MKLAVLFLILAVILFLISRVLKNDPQEEWIEAEAVIVSENEGEVNICYYAEAEIDGKIQKGVSVYYKKSNVNFSKGDRIKIQYHPIPGTFNSFEFRILDPRLKEVSL